MIKKISSLTIGTECQIQGWVHRIRRGKITYFIDLIDDIDETKVLQCIVSKELINDFNNVNKMAFLLIEGKVNALPSKYVTSLGFEFCVSKLLHHSPSKSDFDSIVPINSYNIAYHTLYLRHEQKILFTMLTELVLRSLAATASQLNLIEINPPLYGGIKCEGGAEVYETNHFGKTAYFTQSSQMYLEAMIPVVKRGVYCDVPSFRREKSRTKRHLTQFRHWECEMLGFYSMDEFITFLINFVKTFFDNLFKLDFDKILEKLNRVDFVNNMIRKEFKVLRHNEAISILNAKNITKSNGEAFDMHDDIPEAQERKLIDEIDHITLLTHPPIMTKAFYTATDPIDKSRALAVDIEFPQVGEIMGCSLREQSRKKLEEKLELFTLRDLCDEIIDVSKKYNLDNNLNDLIGKQNCIGLKKEMLVTIEKIKIVEKNIVSDENENHNYNYIDWDKIINNIENIPYDAYEWYFQLRDYGFSMTGGFGIGVERLVTWLSGGEKIDNEYNYSIHSVTTFPRTVDHIIP